MSYWKVLLEKWKAFICNKKRKGKNGLFYIGGSDTLPPPLSAEEEQQAVRAFMGGSKKARDLLIEHNLRLVVYIARKFESAGINVEDLISIGTIGLIKAVNTFKIEKNIKLATYASRCIENEILMYLRRTSKMKGEVSLDEPLGTETDEVYGHLEEEVNRRLLGCAMEKLSGREREIVEMRFGLAGCREMTQKEVAERMGISQSYISRLEKKIIGRLQSEIRKLG